MRRLAPILLVAATLGFAACGGSDNKNSSASNSTGTTQSTTTQATTGATGTTSGTTRKQSAKRKAKAKTGGGTTKTQTQAKTQTQTQTQAQAPTQAPTKTGTTPAPSAPSPFKTSRTVCGTFLPETIQRQLKRGQKTKKAVAKQYSKGYPQAQRNQAYKGCLAGLNSRKK